MVRRCNFLVFPANYLKIPMGYPPPELIILVLVGMVAIMLIHFLGSALFLRRLPKRTSDKPAFSPYRNNLVFLGLAIAIAWDAFILFII